MSTKICKLVTKKTRRKNCSINLANAKFVKKKWVSVKQRWTKRNCANLCNMKTVMIIQVKIANKSCALAIASGMTITRNKSSTMICQQLHPLIPNNNFGIVKRKQAILWIVMGFSSFRLPTVEGKKCAS